ncbi:MAG: Bifunctional protein HldE [Syntrophorhabdaceae bacterium PtaU1.Bin034]|nr:MAG: Bifunctional protein HldE [Syntrophorhabdaceae bacterium PtaU1.Bin034]
MTNRMLDVIDSFKELKVLVIGDAMLDIYLDGFVERVCREAPVSIVDITGQKKAAGGAANTAVNIRSMGGDVTFLSVIGNDREGAVLRKILQNYDVRTDDLLVQQGRSTLLKNRITSGCQILLRFDQGTTDPIDDGVENDVINRLSRLFPRFDAVVVSDYGYGLITPGVIKTIERLQQSAPRTLVVDSKHLLDYRSLNVTSVKPNYDETLRLLGLRKSVTPEQIACYGDEILDITGSRIAAVTLDSKGALFFERGNPPYRTYAHPVHHARATGAGDTFVSAFTLSLALNAPTAVAAEIASAASAVVVGKDGTTACSSLELREYFRLGDKRIDDLGRLAERVNFYRKQGKSIVFTNGCFDILHRGHITYLNHAKTIGDVLIVGMNSDSSVRRLKGPERPINRLEDRIQVLTALSCVDHIIAFDQDTPAEVIRAVRPDVFVKGGDYSLETLPEAPLVTDLGGRIQILPYIDSFSTTDIVDRIRLARDGERARKAVE